MNNEIMQFNSEAIKQRYKVLDLDVFTHKEQKIIIVKLWTNEKREIDYHITITIINGKLIYSGDCGTFVFGDSICSTKPVYLFFCGKCPNPEYWKEKCEAHGAPFYEESLNLDKVDIALNDFIKEQYPDITEETIEEAKIYANYDSVDSNNVRVYDCLKKILDRLGNIDAGLDATNIIDRIQELNPRYLYACKVIQYVCNKLADKNI